MQTLVEIRLIAASRADLEEAIDQLQLVHRAVQIGPPCAGRDAQWLAYGTLDLARAAQLEAAEAEAAYDAALVWMDDEGPPRPMEEVFAQIDAAHAAGAPFKES